MNGPGTEDEFQAIERLLSLERLSRYTDLSQGNRAETIQLYQNNTVLSEALYTPLQGLEVCLRNSCSIELTTLLGATWHDNAHGIFEHPVTEMIEGARRSLTNDGKDITLGRMVSELNFGFWVAILAPRYENQLWRPALRKAFPNRPRGVERKDVHKSINALRRLRNRVAHHEPILHRDLSHDHDQVVRVLEWACRRTAAWIAGQSRLPAVIAEMAKPACLMIKRESK